MNVFCKLVHWFLSDRFVFDFFLIHTFHYKFSSNGFNHLIGCEFRFKYLKNNIFYFYNYYIYYKLSENFILWSYLKTYHKIIIKHNCLLILFINEVNSISIHSEIVAALCCRSFPGFRTFDFSAPDLFFHRIWSHQIKNPHTFMNTI